MGSYLLYLLYFILPLVPSGVAGDAIFFQLQVGTLQLDLYCYSRVSLPLSRSIVFLGGLWVFCLGTWCYRPELLVVLWALLTEPLDLLVLNVSKDRSGAHLFTYDLVSDFVQPGLICCFPKAFHLACHQFLRLPAPEVTFARPGSRACALAAGRSRRGASKTCS